MVTRNIQSEKNALNSFQNAYKRAANLSDPKDAAQVYRIAYPPSAGGLPEEYKNAVDQSLYQGTGFTPPSTTLSQTVAGSNLPKLSQNVETAYQDVQKMSQPNQALSILQDAIRAKSGMADQGIGTSPLFDKLGLTGMGALNASLATQNTAMQNDFSNFSNIVSKMSGTYRDMANTALQNYKFSYDAWKDEADRLQGIQDKIQAHKDALDTLQAQNDAAIKLENYKNLYGRSATEVAAGQSAGLQLNTKTGAWEQAPNTTFASPSGDTYDVAKYAVNNDGTPNMDHINNMNFAVNQMKQMFPETNGQMKSVDDINKWIKQYYPNSPITGDMVSKASEKYGIDWETILATMVAETQMGTDNSKGSREFNYGNVGNTNTAMAQGKSVKLASPQEGVDAVARTMALPFFKRNQVSSGLETISKTTPEGWDISKFTPQFYATKIGQDTINNEQQEKNNFMSQPLVRDFITVQTKADSINNIVNSGITGGPSDLALVFEFMKALDPGSVVRESEYDTASKASNLFKRVAAKMGGYVSKGEILPQEVRDEFLRLSNQKLTANQKIYEKTREEYRKSAFEQGLNPDHVAPDLATQQDNTQVQAPIDENTWKNTLSKTKTADGSSLTQDEINQLISEAKTLSQQGKSQDQIMAALNHALGY
jgi:hypothetical protein